MSEQVTESRRVALDVLGAVRMGEFADRAFSRFGAALDPRDHAWVQELVYGTLRLRGRLDYILGEFVRGGLGSLEPVVLDILRLGSYQLLEMGGVPPYAAVSQSVELARSAGAGRAAGLVNGVLQAVRRGAAHVAFPNFDTDPVGHLSTWGSHPWWLIRRWVERWGPDEARARVEIDNGRADIYLRPVGVDVPEAIERLEEGGIAADPVPLFPDSIRLGSGSTLLAALELVPAVVQDPAAAMVVRYADVADAVVIDLSAAPGGKTVGLAERAHFVAAADLSLGRMRRVRTNVERTGVVSKVGMVVSDGLAPPFRPVDLVLLDAPCTGTGTLRRHPDGRWRITEEDLAALARLQRALLDSAATLVKPTGVLVYATCSLEPEENEWQVEEFLRDHPDFQLVPPASIDPTMLSEGMLTLLPERHGVDGAFAARMVRSN